MTDKPHTYRSFSFQDKATSWWDYIWYMMICVLAVDFFPRIQSQKILGTATLKMHDLVSHARLSARESCRQFIWQWTWSGTALMTLNRHGGSWWCTNDIPRFPVPAGKTLSIYIEYSHVFSRSDKACICKSQRRQVTWIRFLCFRAIISHCTAHSDESERVLLSYFIYIYIYQNLA